MITCIPRWFSNTYEMSGEGHDGRVRFNWLSEQGLVEVNGREYRVQKHGVFSGCWSMLSGTEDLVMAKKDSAFRRTFSLQTQAGPMTLKARSMFGRTMILTGEGIDAVIAPAHMFSRRFRMSGRLPDFEICGFVLWLTIMLQRRQESSD